MTHIGSFWLSHPRLSLLSSPRPRCHPRQTRPTFDSTATKNRHISAAVGTEAGSSDVQIALVVVSPTARPRLPRQNSRTSRTESGIKNTRPSLVLHRLHIKNASHNSCVRLYFYSYRLAAAVTARPGFGLYNHPRLHFIRPTFQRFFFLSVSTRKPLSTLYHTFRAKV